MLYMSSPAALSATRRRFPDTLTLSARSGNVIVRTMAGCAGLVISITTRVLLLVPA